MSASGQPAIKGENAGEHPCLGGLLLQVHGALQEETERRVFKTVPTHSRGELTLEKRTEKVQIGTKPWVLESDWLIETTNSALQEKTMVCESVPKNCPRLGLLVIRKDRLRLAQQRRPASTVRSAPRKALIALSRIVSATFAQNCSQQTPR
ncbi:hypothetical protein COCON_G00230590 [Conger conger]|uniref:Uncharacterized protein n=1 Tax=Conger conger TaxID=82655 RepID=A0A9Q1HMQ4_CONCO|nr:hypothetical protein COCON_G00230590 [Conger conger]